MKENQELKKKKVKDNAMEFTEKLKKKEKQKKKDSKKKERKERNKKNVPTRVGKSCEIPNLKEVPGNCKHLVTEGDLVYVVPGDGCCGPNCAAAFLFQDEVYGPALRKRMN